MKQCLVITDLRGCIVDYNASWTQFGMKSGYTEDFDWHGVNLLQIVEARAFADGILAKQALSKLDDLLQGKDSFTPIECPNYTDKGIQWLLLEITPWYSSESRNVSGLIISISDITSLHVIPHKSPFSRLLPLCAECKRIRDEKDEWHSFERYLKKHLHLEFTHDMCPDCIRHLYPQYSSVLDRGLNE